MSKKSGITRTLKYGGLYAEKVFSMVFLIVVIYGIIYYFQGGLESSNSNTKSSMIPIYFGTISLMMLLITQITNNSRYVPLSISFGSLRKETFIGIQWINFILIIQSVIVFGFSITLISSDFDEMKLFVLSVYTILLIIFSGIGQLIGAASVRFGKLGAFLIGLFVFIIITSGVVALALEGDLNTEISVNNFSLNIKLIAAFVAVIIYIVGSYVNYRVLLNYEVRA